MRVLRVLVVALLGSAAVAVAAPPPLPRVSIDPAAISISGLSSGADFAAQYQVAFSSLLVGSGVFAGQPYHCAVTRFRGEPTVPQCCGTSIGCTSPGCTPATPAPCVPLCDDCPPGRTLAYDHCKRTPGIVNASLLAANAREHASKGLIDPVDNLQHSRIYLYRGTKDLTYLKGSVQAVEDMLRLLGAEHILFNNTTPSGHSWPTETYGTPCGSGVIEACHYDGPGAALNQIYGPLKPPVDAVASSLIEFDQSPFMSADNNGTAHYNETTPRATGLAPAGYVYVPSACRHVDSRCRLHFSLHGCGVNGYYDEAVHHLGFQRWGEANGIVIVFPRIQPHGGTTETQSGCWDAYGQTGADYAFKSGVQMQAVRKMMQAVSGV